MHYFFGKVSVEVDATEALLLIAAIIVAIVVSRRRAIAVRVWKLFSVETDGMDQSEHGKTD